jgi:hypothetical protein
MNTNFDRLDRHKEGRKTHRRYVNTQDTDVQTDNICSDISTRQAGFCVFVVSNIYSNGCLTMPFLTDIHDIISRASFKLF